MWFKSLLVVILATQIASWAQNAPAPEAPLPGYSGPTIPTARGFPSTTRAPANTNQAQAVFHFTLSPSTIAPHKASGTAEVAPGSISLHLSQLGPGRYELEAIRQPGSVHERLGAITIVDPTLSPSRQATDNKREASAGPEQTRVETDVQIKLAPEIALDKLSRIALLDSAGNTVLAGNAQ